MNTRPTTDATQLARLAVRACTAEEKEQVFREFFPQPTAAVDLTMYRPGDAAKRLGFSRTLLWKLTKEGKIRGVTIRKGSTRYLASELRRFAEGRAS